MTNPTPPKIVTKVAAKKPAVTKTLPETRGVLAGLKGISKSRGGKAKKPAKLRMSRAAKVAKPNEAKEIQYFEHYIELVRALFLAKTSDKSIATLLGLVVGSVAWLNEELAEFRAAFCPNPRNVGRPPIGWNCGNIAMAEMLASLGATDLEIAQAFEISIRTMYRWKLDHVDFREALLIGKEIADTKVEDALYKRATGYSFDSEKIIVIAGKGERFETIEHVPPDVKAAMWWLQNRKPQTWRDVRHIKHDVENATDLGKFLQSISGKSFAPITDEEHAAKITTSHDK